MRIGQEKSRNRSAVKVWDQREYRNLDDSVELGTRNIKVALRRLRKFARQGAPDEFDLENTITSTARKAYLDIHMRPERRNAIKVLMLMDIGGTMDDHIKLAEELFSAAKTEFKHLEFFYFHNCLYDFVWKDNRRRHSERTRTWDLLHKYGHDYKVIFVGDATMSPYEILQPGGSIEYFNEEPGAVWIKRFMEIYPKCVWLNPEPEEIWSYRQSIGVIKELMNGRMYPDHAEWPRAGDEAAGEMTERRRFLSSSFLMGRRAARRRRCGHGGARAQAAAARAAARQAFLRAAGRGHCAVADPAAGCSASSGPPTWTSARTIRCSTTTPSTSTSAARAACWSSPTRHCTACSSRCARATRWCAPASASRRRPRRISTSSAAPRTGSSIPSRREQAEALVTRSNGRYRIERVMKIPLLDINELMRKHWNGPPNLLSLDTEGLDLAILRSLDFERLRPDVICVESVEVGGRRVTPEIMQLMAQKGYDARGGSFVNTIFVDRRHLGLTMPKWPALLRRTFRLQRLRPGQREVIDSVLAGRDTLAIMPSGAGKSLCYQLPALQMRGTTIVVSPLIALMKDQSDKLEERGVDAAAVNSALSARERREAERPHPRQRGRLHLHHARAARRAGVPEKAEGEPDRPLRGRRSPLHHAVGPRFSSRLRRARQGAARARQPHPARPHGHGDP